MEFRGEEWLFYEAFPINVAFIRGTTADPAGNITMEKEALTLDNLAMAMAARNSGGFVIAQVERIAEAGSLHPRHVQVPAILVDCIVVAQPENHHQTYASPYSPAFSAEVRVPLDSLPPMPLDDRKLIARRCAFELPAGGVVNLGIGMPEGVAAIANEEQILKYVTLTAEPGVIGGVPASGLNFGAAINPEAIIHQNQQFDFYDGGGLDMACLGLAECDEQGNLNVSRFGPKLAGAGGFINISQNARKVVFAGTFTAGGLQVAIEDGRVRIVQEGRARKFVKRVGQVTFSGAYAAEIGQPVYYVTERCVFERTKSGVKLIEVAPGVDVESDILAHMDFTPIVDIVAEMDPRIFRAETMGLENVLVGRRELASRISYDTSRNILFLNFEGLQYPNEIRRDGGPESGGAMLPEDRPAHGGYRKLRNVPHRRGRARCLRGDGPVHGGDLLHPGHALQHRRLPPHETRRGPGKTRRRPARVRDRGRSACVSGGLLTVEPRPSPRLLFGERLPGGALLPAEYC